MSFCCWCVCGLFALVYDLGGFGLLGSCGFSWFGGFVCCGLVVWFVLIGLSVGLVRLVDYALVSVGCSI